MQPDVDKPMMARGRWAVTTGSIPSGLAFQWQ